MAGHKRDRNPDAAHTPDEPPSKRTKVDAVAQDEEEGDDDIMLAATQATAVRAGQSHLERLPNELLTMINENAENPWLALSSRRLFQLDTKTTRTAIIKKAFTPFGLPFYRAHLPQAAGKVTYQEYMKVFADAVELPWFFKSVFSPDKKTRLIKPGEVGKWATKAFAGPCLFLQPVWTEALGRFVEEFLKRWPKALKACRDTHWHVRKGLASAIDQGCLPAVRMLSGLSIETSDSDDIYDNDLRLPKCQWSQRWKHQTLGAIGPEMDEDQVFWYAPIEEAMTMLLIDTDQCKYSSLTSAYVNKFWESFFAAKANGKLIEPNRPVFPNHGAPRFYSRVMDVLHHPDCGTLEKFSSAIHRAAMSSRQVVYQNASFHMPPSGWESVLTYQKLDDARTVLEAVRKATHGNVAESIVALQIQLAGYTATGTSRLVAGIRTQISVLTAMLAAEDSTIDTPAAEARKQVGIKFRPDTNREDMMKILSGIVKNLRVQAAEEQFENCLAASTDRAVAEYRRLRYMRDYWL